MDCLNERMNKLETSNEHLIQRLKQETVCSAREKLIRQYRRFAVLAPILGSCQLILLRHELGWGLKLIIAFYFITAGLMDLYLWQGMKGLDLHTLGVVQLARKSLFYRHRHHQFQVILIGIALPTLFMLYLHWEDNVYARWGMLTGLLLGAIAGTSVYFRMMRSYRELADSIKMP